MEERESIRSYQRHSPSRCPSSLAENHLRAGWVTKVDMVSAYHPGNSTVAANQLMSLSLADGTTLSSERFGRRDRLQKSYHYAPLAQEYPFASYPFCPLTRTSTTGYRPQVSQPFRERCTPDDCEIQGSKIAQSLVLSMPHLGQTPCPPTKNRPVHVTIGALIDDNGPVLLCFLASQARFH